MKKLPIIIAMLFALNGFAQRFETLTFLSKTGCDTTPVFVIYIDSTQLYAQAPIFSYGLEVVPGWMISCFENSDLLSTRYFDEQGIEFPERIVLMCKERTYKPLFRR